MRDRDSTKHYWVSNRAVDFYVDVHRTGGSQLRLQGLQQLDVHVAVGAHVEQPVSFQIEGSRQRKA